MKVVTKMVRSKKIIIIIIIIKDRKTRKIEPVALIPNDTNPVNL